MPLVRRTRATLRSAEFGFFGVVVYTRVHTPRRWGAPLRAAVLPLAGFDSRPLRTSCWIVGTTEPLRRSDQAVQIGRSDGVAARTQGTCRPPIVRAGAEKRQTPRARRTAAAPGSDEPDGRSY